MSDAPTPITPTPLMPDFGICKDVAAARNLIASMREGHGRHNSRAMDRGGGGPNIISRYTSSPWIDLLAADRQRCTVESLRAAQEQLRQSTFSEAERYEREYLGSWPPARVIGRLGDHAIRERPQDCGVGDAVPEGCFPDNSEILFARYYAPISGGDRPAAPATWTFERVRTRHIEPARGIDDITYHWKRIE